jgi:hypothetical protein
MEAILIALLQAATLVMGAQSDEFIVEAPGRVQTVKVKGDSLTGPDVQASWSGTELRGSAFDRPLDLKVSGDRIEGLIGGKQVNLRVGRSPEGLRLQGTYGGQLSDLTVGPRKIDGHLGRCGYTLQPQASVYRGTRRCGLTIDPGVSVQIPAQLAQASPMRLAAELAVLLGGY